MRAQIPAARASQRPVWAAGVTFLRSRDARLEESRGLDAYDKVYLADRPELFLKALPGTARGPGQPIGVRADSDWDVPEPELAVVAAKRALSLDPTIAEAYCVLSRHLSENGRLDEAFSELETGLKLDPDSWELHKAAANLLYSQGKIADAAHHFEKAAQAMETDFHAWGMLHSCYNALGDAQRARDAARKTLEEAEKVLAQDPSNGAAISFAVTGLAALGENVRAKEWMERALLIDPDNLNMRYNFACTLASVMSDREAALEMVKPTITLVKGSLGNVEFDPDLELIRDDPEFQSWIAEAKARLARSRQARVRTATPTAT